MTEAPSADPPATTATATPSPPQAALWVQFKFRFRLVLESSGPTFERRGPLACPLMQTVLGRALAADSLWAL